MTVVGPIRANVLPTLRMPAARPKSRTLFEVPSMASGWTATSTIDEVVAARWSVSNAVEWTVEVNKALTAPTAGVAETSAPQEDEAHGIAAMAWFQEHLAELVKQFPSEWVAILDGRVVAHGADLPTVVKQAARLGIEDAFLGFAPAKVAASLYL